MENNKEKLIKGIRITSISLGVIIIAPIVLTMGFKGILLEKPLIGYVLLVVGFVAIVTGMVLLIKGIKYLLDHLFEK